MEQQEMVFLCTEEQLREMKEEGMTNAEIAEVFEIPEAAVFKMVNIAYKGYVH